MAVQRESDSRLTLLVHGLSRAVVVRPLQELPYARADVQLLPDDEALSAAAVAAGHFLQACRAAMKRCETI